VRPSQPNVLIGSGLDPSGGAGFLADARVVARLGARPVGIVTALTVQDTCSVHACHPVDAEVIGAQLTALLSDIEIGAVKLGVLGSPEVARELGRCLALTAAPVVWDPVGAPSRGSIGFDRALFEAALVELAPHLTLVTPNLAELQALLGLAAPITSLEQATAAGRQLVDRTGVSVLVKGGHLGGAQASDVLCQPGGVEILACPRISEGHEVHGTGCALSSAIATHLALGLPLLEACRAAKQFVAERIEAPIRPGRGVAAVV